ncbi:MAG: GTPase HflX [Lachnospiraceae bacterium]|nr:GTPase HflX [Lachnospiraceae bacterium]
MNEIKDVQERLILFAVNTDEHSDTRDSIEELKELVKTAGAETVGTMIQNLSAPVSGTYLGKGKIEELREMIYELDATGVVCDDELSPAQMKNLEDTLGVKVMDRTLVILDIFANHAKSAEGKIQVELAQLRYRMTRLAGFGTSMSRLGGGIGTRGPGETKLESDRRVISGRISKLKQELKKIEAHRDLTRKQRERNSLPVAAIVGYTNAGKSTLLNALTDAGILAEDQLFATLDTTTRKMKLPGNDEILLTDTVGFIRKLPHHLIDAFKSTLEEAVYADYVVHVVDASNPQMDEQMKIVYETLAELGVSNKKILTLFNKCDKLVDQNPLQDFRANKVLRISAKKKTGLTEACDALEEFLREDRIFVEAVLSYKDMALLEEIRKTGELQKESYEEDGIHVSAYVTRAVYGKISSCIIE